MTNSNRVPNRLINEKSPYLLQHAHNPVDWYPWGEEAFKKAKKEDKPIFLSIGYSTCHWCHVMERESFEDEEVADFLNSNFISIKVDREERADIDSIYMSFCQAYTGSGGWPLTIIMTPDKKPFFAGTYFPKQGRGKFVGLLEILNSVISIWHEERQNIDELTKKMESDVKTYILAHESGDINSNIVQKTFEEFKIRYEKDYGGFSRAPKFPTPHNLLLLLRYYYTTKNKEALEMVEHTLISMYKGGVFDHIGFGFSRYSTDKYWLVPHFEKMLYDNAMLSYVYVEAYRATGKELYKEIADKIYTYVLRDMTDPLGGFYSAEDADSEGVEGKFYVWTIDEITNLLGKENGEKFCKLYDITSKGNFEGKNILNLISKNLEDLKVIDDETEQSRNILFKEREKRIHPYKDDKILTSWNGLMIASLAYAGRIFENDEYLNAAKRCVEFIRNNLINDKERVLGRFRDGEAANLGLLDDYAYYTWGLIELYESTLEVKYLKEAIKLNGDTLKLFLDKEHGGFYLYGEDAEELILRPKDIYDGALPSGNSVAVFNMIKLSNILEDNDMLENVRNQFSTFGETINQNPSYYSHLIDAWQYASTSYKNIILVGEKQDELLLEMIKEVNNTYLPYSQVIINDKEDDIDQIIPSLKYKEGLNKKVTAYVCENYTCKEPVIDLQSFKKNIE
ncbi:thioredoxin domain-containing protein [Clostridium peptidivorans]|uniref:thioredoxin domain-containing protein n=1 Tax=Clostridium peptidivorans TaxID=100174 RepID=UPI000BE470A2|nr:thioredoxin domain-containing protein [Clostridium peptidivorans]